MDSRIASISVDASLVDTSCFRVMMSGSNQPILGTVASENGLLIFRPVWPLKDGIGYEVYNCDKLIETVQVSQERTDPPTVTLYPSTPIVPENLLKVYLVFSQPMEVISPYDHIALTHGKDTLHGSILELSTPLWNSEQTMLTVWLDPGRIKRDLLLNQELGTPLKDGEEYEIHLHGWRNKWGTPMDVNLVKNIRVVSPDRRKPRKEDIAILLPPINSSQALTILFSESMDYGSLLGSISIHYHGKEVEGSVFVVKEDQIIFKPKQPWRQGEYELVVKGDVEDLSGNTYNRLFDIDLSKQESNRHQATDVVVTFQLSEESKTKN